MTDGRTKKLTQELKRHDRDLYVVRQPSGMHQVYRRSVRWETHEFEGQMLRVSRPNPQFVLPLTHDWSLQGKPVEWGIEPLLAEIKARDNWRDDSAFEEMKKRRDREASNRERENRNEFRARAADMRRDFARATNDINTSSLEKVDRRRMKDGTSQ